jgi:hypothetical protein
MDQAYYQLKITQHVTIHRIHAPMMIESRQLLRHSHPHITAGSNKNQSIHEYNNKYYFFYFQIVYMKNSVSLIFIFLPSPSPPSSKLPSEFLDVTVKFAVPKDTSPLCMSKSDPTL